MNKLLLFLGLMWPLLAATQPDGGKKAHPLIISLYNNATLLPGAAKAGIWSVPLHPGFTVGTEFYYRQKARHQWLQTANLAYHYHQYAVHSIQLYSEAGYRRRIGTAFDAEAKLGLGYLHSIPDAQIFQLNAEGAYEKKANLGRPQAMGGLALGVGYSFQGKWAPRAFLAYRFYMQFPFVNEYVPVLPNTALHVGVALSVWE
ncbi:MAG: hypothetical protein KDD19_17935 [Phaeodactylibacter sp.]|nr:hypothetical protein [Phaeodactylibacter sp.]MCB9052103.1 hypothetical protein [Lewinellaceae bacterium]